MNLSKWFYSQFLFSWNIVSNLLKIKMSFFSLKGSVGSVRQLKVAGSNPASIPLCGVQSKTSTPKWKCMKNSFLTDGWCIRLHIRIAQLNILNEYQHYKGGGEIHRELSHQKFESWDQLKQCSLSETMLSTIFHWVSSLHTTCFSINMAIRKKRWRALIFKDMPSLWLTWNIE